jgi:hypothetical protein
LLVGERTESRDLRKAETILTKLQRQPLASYQARSHSLLPSVLLVHANGIPVLQF